MIQHTAHVYGAGEDLGKVMTTVEEVKAAMADKDMVTIHGVTFTPKQARLQTYKDHCHFTVEGYIL